MKQLKKLTNIDIKEQMMIMSSKTLNKEEGVVYRWLFDELDGRLTDDDFDYFLDQLDAVQVKSA